MLKTMINQHGEFKVGTKIIGGTSPCFVIAEVGLAHEGSLGMAHSFIDAVAETGADAVKFQTHIPLEEGTIHEKFRIPIFPQDSTRQDYWARTSFTELQWAELKTHAEKVGLVFLSTPFSIAAVQMLRRLGIEAWKIGSGETNNLPMIEEIAVGKEPVFLSSGMSYISEIACAVELLKESGSPTLLMQCTNKYPCPPEYWGLNLLKEYKERFGVLVGFSDHSGDIAATIAAIALGAQAVEVHVTWHKACFGPDVKASLTLEQLTTLVRSAKDVGKALNNPLEKNAFADQMKEMRQLFTKGVVAKEDLPKGMRIEEKHIETKKPCLGIPAAEYKKLIGKITVRNISKDEFINWGDVS